MAQPISYQQLNHDLKSWKKDLLSNSDEQNSNKLANQGKQNLYDYLVRGSKTWSIDVHNAFIFLAQFHNYHNAERRQKIN